jgi:two-component system, NarL family, invasion response regulator UvrY
LNWSLKSPGGEEMIRILGVDDHGVVLEGLKKLANSFVDGAIVGEARNGAEALQLIGSSEWDIVVLDISLEGVSGLEVLKELKKRCPKLPVLMLSMHGEEVYARRAIKAGAQGYLTKVSPPEELVEAINRIVRGGRYITPALVEALVFAPTSDKLPHENLSDREYEVMLLIARGLTNKEISEELNLDSRTITTHRRRILDKMNLNTGADINEYARRNKLLN